MINIDWNRLALAAICSIVTVGVLAAVQFYFKEEAYAVYALLLIIVELALLFYLLIGND